MPARALESIALLVIFILYCLIASGIPGTSFSIISLVASGVTSLILNPVPPVVSTRFNFRMSDIFFISSERSFLSSGRIKYFITFILYFSTISFIATPLLSILSFLAPLSLLVIIPTVYILFTFL